MRLRVDAEQPQTAVIEQAAATLRRGELVVLPTETVYGLGADALDVRAVARIFAAKGRPSDNPLIVHVLDAAGARALVREWPALAERLAARFWPGPLTLVLPKRPEVPDLVTAGLASVAVRAPAHPVARALLAATGRPIAAPSANRYQGISPTRAEHVERSLGAELTILDAGPTPEGIESTVLALDGERPRLLRPGALALAELEAVAGPIAGPSDGPSEGFNEALREGPRRSPGMDRRHYAPRGRVYLAPRPQLLAALPGLEGPVGSLSFEPALAGVDHALTLPAQPRGYARGLYAALHTLDALGCRTLVIEAVPEGPDWAAVGDRLARAGG